MSLPSFVITGAKSQLAQVLARHLAPTTEHIIVTTRGDNLPECYSSIPNIHGLPGLDLLSDRDLATLRDSIVAIAPSRFHVFNALGSFPGYNLVADVPPLLARRVYESNLLALYGVAHSLLALMVDCGGGHFLACSCHNTDQCFPMMAAFSSAKAGVEALIRGIANEYGEYGVVANTLALATLDTETERAMKPFGDHDNWLRMDDVASLVCQLLEQPFSIMNGTTLHLYKHSPSYFREGYFSRIRQT